MLADAVAQDVDEHAHLCRKVQPFGIDGDVVVTAWKPSEDGEGWILRLQETSGHGTEVELHFDEERQVTIVDLLERSEGETITDRDHSFPLHKHGILTLKVR